MLKFADFGEGPRAALAATFNLTAPEFFECRCGGVLVLDQPSRTTVHSSPLCQPYREAIGGVKATETIRVVCVGVEA